MNQHIENNIKGYVANIVTSFNEIPNEICSSVYLSGCDFHCIGCQNPELQNPKYGNLSSISDIINNIENNNLTKWVCFLGGEPFYQHDFLFEICKKIYKPIGIYTGYDFTKLTQRFSHIINIENVLFLKTGLFDVKNIIKNEFPITKNQEVYIKYNNTWNKCNYRTIESVSSFMSEKLNTNINNFINYNNIP